MDVCNMCGERPKDLEGHLALHRKGKLPGVSARSAFEKAFGRAAEPAELEDFIGGKMPGEPGSPEARKLGSSEASDDESEF